MGVKCAWIEGVLAVVILVFAIWPGIVSWSNWVIIVAAALLLYHSLSCHKCGGLCVGMMKGGKKKKG